MSVISAIDFTQSLGVGVHFEDKDGSYPSSDVLAQLQYLGIINVRAGVPDSSNISRYQQLGQAGIRFNIVVVSDHYSPADPAREIEGIDAIAPWVSTVEGPNEVNALPIHYNGLTGMQAAYDFQRDLYNGVHADPLLANVGVLAYSLSVGASMQGWANVSQWADYANIHAYGAGGVPPYYYLDAETYGVPTVQDKPIFITETGFPTAPGDKGVTQDVATKWTLDSMLQAADMGVKKTFVYQLEDEVADTGTVDSEHHYGLFDVNGVAKESAFAVHNLTTILRDGGNVPTNPLAEPWTLSGVDRNSTFSTEFVKSNGNHDIALWWEPNLYDQNTGKETEPAHQTAILNFTQYHEVDVYDPIQSSTPIAHLAAANQVTLDLGSDPLIIETSSATFNPRSLIKLTDTNGHVYSTMGLASGNITTPIDQSSLSNNITQSTGADGVVTLSTPQWGAIKTIGITDFTGGSWATNAFLETNVQLSGAQNGSLLLTNAKRGVLDLSHDGNYHVTINAHSNAPDPMVNGVTQHLNDFVVSLGSGENIITLRGDGNQTHGVFTTGSGHGVIFGAAGGNDVTFGSGRAEATGGTGADHYVYHANSGVDIIQNFDSLHDTITLDSSLKSSMHLSTGAEGTTLMFGSAAHELVLHAISNFDPNTIHWSA